MTIYVALLHSVVLTPQRRVIMSDLRAMAEEIGFRNPRTLVSTGNLIFETKQKSVAQIEKKLETAFASRFGRIVDIIARSADGWRAIVSANPFPEESGRDGDRVAARIMRKPLDDEALAALRPYQKDERLAVVAGDLWCSFAGKPSESRLLPAMTTKRLGVGTSRNWNTIRGIGEMLGD
ncbi:DUF1697 domain-containing protein [Terrarubrum flagellatum]|uniref:DUF1697 domain-containing protein n=1 Tax=Terrirubrum flagellatum TaxID=2895980 RepID=UPI003144EC0E